MLSIVAATATASRPTTASPAMSIAHRSKRAATDEEEVGRADGDRDREEDRLGEEEIAVVARHEAAGGQGRAASWRCPSAQRSARRPARCASGGSGLGEQAAPVVAVPASPKPSRSRPGSVPTQAATASRCSQSTPAKNGPPLAEACPPRLSPPSETSHSIQDAEEGGFASPRGRAAAASVEQGRAVAGRKAAAAPSTATRIAMANEVAPRARRSRAGRPRASCPTVPRGPRGVSRTGRAREASAAPSRQERAQAARMAMTPGGAAVPVRGCPPAQGRARDDDPEEGRPKRPRPRPGPDQRAATVRVSSEGERTRGGDRGRRQRPGRVDPEGPDAGPDVAVDR